MMRIPISTDHKEEIPTSVLLVSFMWITQITMVYTDIVSATSCPCCLSQ